jgi:alkyl sulfatase BDS1-like metallo-beta-lactamase superfamily hydrolase
MRASRSADGSEAIQLIRYREVHLEHPRPDVHVARQLISNASWVDTDDGTVVVDTLLTPEAGRKMLQAIRQQGSRPVRYVIFTHGHLDHVGGARAFLADAPVVLGHRFLPERLEKYELLKVHRARIASVQFNIPFRPVEESFVYPERTFADFMSFSLGGKTFELHHARGETDDHCWVFVPEIGTVLVGDLLIGSLPNIGNPFKPTRFALPWARALEAIRAKGPELIVAGGGRATYEGATVRAVLDATIEAIYAIHDQVVRHINAGVPLDEMVHLVKLPQHLQDSPYLRFVYSRPEFAVFNIHRWYHGYFDHNPAHLLPRPQGEVNEEIFGLIGSRDAIMKRTQELLEKDRAQLALQILDILLQHDPEDGEARAVRLKILEALCARDGCVMSRNTYVHFMERDREFLKGGP